MSASANVNSMISVVDVAVPVAVVVDVDIVVSAAVVVDVVVSVAVGAVLAFIA